MSISKYSERREALVKFVVGYAAEHGCSPTAAMLKHRLGWSQASCQGYLQRLGEEIPLPPPRKSMRSHYLFYRPHILRLIRAYTVKHGYAPTLRYLAGKTGLAPATLRRYLRRMREQGLVDFTPGVARSLRVR